jgi:hypothetical protein
MGRKDKDKKIDGISATQSSSKVKPTESVSEVDRVKGATHVQGVSRIKGVGRTQAVDGIEFEQKAKLFGIVAEETEKLVAQGIVPKNQREVVEQAVRMILDGALLNPHDKKK